LKSQLIGLENIHNARQLGGYRIGNKTIKENLLLRSAKLSDMTEADSLLLCNKYKVQCIYDFRGKDEAVSDPDPIPGNARYLSLSLSFTDGNSQSGANIGSKEDMIKMLLENAEHPAIQAMCTNMYDIIFFEESSQEVYRKFFADLLATDPEMVLSFGIAPKARTVQVAHLQCFWPLWELSAILLWQTIFCQRTIMIQWYHVFLCKPSLKKLS
ncbi:MAG: tyrosine-protein phosphatase, partial [Bacteroidales bacterium]|nr:tyrosine-protein phosphatase [Bacteroidales bacterium]